MNKYFVMIAVGLCTAQAFAQNTQTTAEAELLSAKVAYQQALNEQDSLRQKVSDTTTRLDLAKRRFNDAQNEMQAAQKAFDEVNSAHQQSNSLLQEAGKRLDAAWGAVHRP